MLHRLSILLAVSGLSLAACADPPAEEAAPPPATPERVAPEGYEIPEPVAGAGWVPLDVTFSKELPEGYEQQLPDSRLPDEPLRVGPAMAEAFAALEETRRITREAIAASETGEIVLVDGVAGHVQGQGAGGGPQVVVAPDRRSPVNTYQVCSGLILGCARHSGTVDGCVEVVPRCEGDTPWMDDQDCCPESCTGQYTALRGAGLNVAEAFATVFVHDTTCFPGLPGKPPAHEGDTQGGE